ncbi:unnamed protein product [Lathyrus oleraceus]
MKEADPMIRSLAFIHLSRRFKDSNASPCISRSITTRANGMKRRRHRKKETHRIVALNGIRVRLQFARMRKRTSRISSCRDGNSERGRGCGGCAERERD